MNPKKLLFLYPLEKATFTGGQIIEEYYYQIASENAHADGYVVERRFLNLKKAFGLKLVVQSLRALKLFPQLRKYDAIIYNDGSYGYFWLIIGLLKLWGGAQVLVLHHFTLEGMSGWRFKLLRFMQMHFYRTMNEIIAPSPYQKVHIPELVQGPKIRYWQCPIRENDGIRSSPKVGNLLYIGTIEFRKGLHLLIEAMTKAKHLRPDLPLRLTIVGKCLDDGYKQQLENRIATEALDVTFSGYLSDEELRDIKKQADIFAFPSLLEGYGLVICEAMVEGMPVVCFDNSAMPYTVRDGENGRLIKNCDTDKYAEALVEISTDRELRNSLSKGALKTAETFMTFPRFRQMVSIGLRQILGT